MLQFFKKHSDLKRGNSGGSEEQPQQRASTSSLLHRGAAVVDDRLLEAERFCQEIELNEQQQNIHQGTDDGLSEPLPHHQPHRHSTATRGFAKQILHIVTNKNALSYFVQFLDTRDQALPLIKFWLDADSFRIAAGAELSRTGSLAGTPLPVDHRPHTSAVRPKPVLRKSVSLDAFNATSYDDESLGADSGSQCTVGSLEDLPEDNEDPVPIGERCASSASVRCKSELSGGMVDEDAVVVEAEAKISEMGRPLTDDEKSQLCERKHLQLNLKQNIEHIPKRNCFQTSLASDAVRIYKKYLTNSVIDIPATHVSAIALALGSTEATSIDESDEIKNIFVDAQSHVLEMLARTQLEEFLQSSFYAKYCVDVLTSERLGIEDILYSDAALFYLMEFLEQDSQRHLLEFWVAAVNFTKLCREAADGSAVDLGQQQSDALVLYEKYFSLQATCSLGLSDWVRSQIEEDICTTDRMVIGHCFGRAVAVIERYLDQKYFKAFVTSNLFYRYLSELLHKIDEPAGQVAQNQSNQNQSSNKSRSRHRKTASDASAEHFHRNISTQNTLLAINTNPAKKPPSVSASSSSKVRPSPTADMQIDGRLLSDPDLLWSRRGGTTSNGTGGGGLSFGRVNALGRYERDFDMEPSLTNRSAGEASKHPTKTPATSSKLRRVVRKLVNLPEDRAQEEIAWQVAEMIVRDITSVTLYGQHTEPLPVDRQVDTTHIS